jgi:hypothetical protein
LLAGSTFGAGCAREPRGTPNIEAPPVGPARAAIVTTLDAWKSGRRSSGKLGSNPVIGIVDSQRTERPLIEYEVVGPLAVVDKIQPFAVRLELDTPRETVMARYCVLGQDPLYVFRQEDFDMMLHWEHKMPPASAADGSAPATEGPTVAADKPVGPGGG